MSLELKPDLGLYFSEIFDNTINHHFYDVKIFDILHIDEGLYSFTSCPTIDGQIYAATFDFTLGLLEELIIQVNNQDFRTYLETVLIKKYTEPEKVAFYDAPLFVDIEAVLGNPVKSKYETFVPFTAKKFSNLR